MSLEKLPEDILLEIVAKLPAKSFKRLSCVCKAWRTLLEKPHSIEKHTENLNSNKDAHALVYLGSRRDRRGRDYAEEFFALSSRHHRPYRVGFRAVRIPQHHKSYVKSRQNQFSYLELPEHHRSYMKVIGSSCNGILCLESTGYGYPSSRVYLYNPTTWEDMALPPSIFNDDYFETCALGFGFDASSKDYKVIRIRRAKLCLDREKVIRLVEEGRFFGEGIDGLTLLNDNLGDHWLRKKHVEIYKSSTRRWSKIDADIKEMYADTNECRGVFVNGFFYWLWGIPFHDEKNIPRFNIHAETFEVVEFMCLDLKTLTIRVRDPARLWLAALDGSLAVCAAKYSRGDDTLTVDVWIMKEYGDKQSWTKKFSVKSMELKKHRFVESLMFHGTSLLVLLRRFSVKGKHGWMSDHILLTFTLEDDGEGGTKFIATKKRLSYHNYLNLRGVIFQPSLVSLSSS